jgi:gluconokinase
MTLGEYLELRLFGQARVSLSVASWSGLLDRHRLAWDGPLLEALALPEERLSPLVDRDAPLHGLSASYAARWPALRDVPWFPAVGDGAAANIGSGATGDGRIALTVGTSGAMRVVRKEVVAVPPGLWSYRVDRRHALLGGATSEGGNVYDWLRQSLRLSEREALEAALAATEPDGHGLTVLPFVAGERSPGWAGNARATIHGVTVATTPLDILRASFEAIAYRFALIGERMAFDPGADYRLVASGSALLRSPGWMQIFADVLGKPVVASAETEATSRGAAILALHALGEIPSLDALPAADGASYQPDAVRHARYRAAIARQQWLYERLIAAG